MAIVPGRLQGVKVVSFPDGLLLMCGSPSQTAAPVCWALVGPTAAGKSAVALELARRHPVEVVSVDSMQVYRGMDIGTAKPPPEQRRAVPHHMIDVLDAEQRCNVGWFCRKARGVIEQIRARGNRPLVVGGAPLYLKGLLWGLAQEPRRDPQVRRRLRRLAEVEGSGVLHQRLARVDPESAEQIHPNDVQRLVRSLEVWELTGEPPSEGRDQFDGEPDLLHLMVGLRRRRTDLYERINRRVDRMMGQGLLQEVRRMRERLGPQASQAIAYKELGMYTDGKISMSEAVALIKRNTRRYAKHQLTWFRHFPQLHWVDVATAEEPAETALRCEAVLTRSA